MYCNKCGYIVKNGMVKCPECGRDLKDIEYSGGFWNLVGTESQKKSLKDDKVETIDPYENQPGRLRGIATYILLGLSLVLFGFGMIQSNRAKDLNRKYDTLQKQYEDVSKELNALQSEYDELSVQYEEVGGEKVDEQTDVEEQENISPQTNIVDDSPFSE